MSINTQQGELLIVQVSNNKVYCDACRQGMTKQEALDYADSLKRYADSLVDKPAESELEYLGIIVDTVERTRFFRMPDHVWPNNCVQSLAGHLATKAPSIVGFLGYAVTRDQKDNFAQTFTPDMKFVVIRKG